MLPLPFIQSIPDMSDEELAALVGKLRQMRADAITSGKKGIKARSEKSSKVAPKKVATAQLSMELILARMPEELRAQAMEQLKGVL